MKKILALTIILFSFNSISHAQLMISKMIGKNSGNSKLGWGLFTYLDFPLAGENQSIRIELLDFAYFPVKDEGIVSPIGYLSIKAGYKYVFSETQEGFYLEPQAGWVRSVYSDPPNDNHTEYYGDGLALALEGGYSLGVGQGGNMLNFGLKYETDMPGTDYTLSSIGLRVSFSFHLFRKKNE